MLIMEKKKHIITFHEISDKIGNFFNYVGLVFLLWFFFRKLVFLERNRKIAMFGLSDILKYPDFQGKNSSGVRKLKSGQSNLFLTSFSSASVIRLV